MSEMHVDSEIDWIACDTPVGVLKQNPGPIKCEIFSPVEESMVVNKSLPSTTRKYSTNSGWKWFPRIFPGLKYRSVNSLIESDGTQLKIPPLPSATVSKLHSGLKTSICPMKFLMTHLPRH